MAEVFADREIPAWFNEDKFGIFVVWGPYSVPSYKHWGYAEWYWKHSQSPNRPKSMAFHERVYGKDFPYENFAEMFTAEMWDPDFWCKLFADSGAKYVVTTANYHDGFAMWPTEYSATQNADKWNSMEVGPKRDILGELNEAGNKHGLKMGIYYSLYEWYHPLWLQDKERFATEWFHPKFKEVVSKYKPWHIFLDGEWDLPWDKWRSNELAHWLYNESPVKDTVVVNDRWGHCRGEFGDVIESEFGGGKFTTPERPWQEDRGIGNSYGYNRAEDIYDYDSRETLLQTFSGVVGGGGNFLLCVGPTADGRIPVIMQERLLQVGKWLKVNGEAIYGTTASPFWPRQFEWGTVSAKPGKLYLHIHNPDLSELTVHGIDVKVTQAKLLYKKGDRPVQVKKGKDSLSLSWNGYLNDEGVTIIALDVEEGYTVDQTPRQFESGIIDFHARAMKVHGDTVYVRYNGDWNKLYVEDWWKTDEYLSADFIVDQPGKFKVTVICSSPEEKEADNTGGRYRMQLGDSILEQEVTDVGRDRRIREVEIGTVELSEGTQPFSIKPVDDGNWKGFLFQGIRLEPIQ
ncbi:alpha-L-fucosidase [Coraliomargarita akajimensis]|nr:alpha-L-fucosidase [Coraliomargarita akajimensis]